MRRSPTHRSASAPQRTWKQTPFLPLLLGIGLTFLIVFSANAAAVITATKTDAFIGGDADGKADPGETIEYTVTIANTGTVAGTDDALNVEYTDTIDANTTLASVSVSPVAANDVLPVTVTGNVALNTALMATPFSVVTNDYQGQNIPGGLSIASYDTLSAQGGSVTMVTSGAGIGRFTYNPPAGYEGADTFTYTLVDNSNASSPVANRRATVTINISGMIWFVNNNAALTCTTDGCGRLSNPYSTLAAFNAANDGTDILFSHHPAANDSIFIYESATAYTGGITLLSGQKLIGQDSTQTLSAITGLNPPTGSVTFPAMNPGVDATIIQNSGGNGVTLNSGNTLNGFTAGNATGSAISGSGFGTLTVADLIVNTSGQALSLTNGTLSATFSSVTSTGGTNNIALAGPLSGNLMISAGALSGATGNAFDISGGTATISNAATIASGTARSVDITGLTGGSVTFSGAISDNDTGINLSTNTGATINFNGGMALSTGANTAFTATGGGIINATQNNTSIVNTLTTTTGTALNVANTTIGASNLTFRSISSNGAVNGIVLNNTGSSGGLIVSGNGGTCSSTANCTGGAIQNSTGAGIALTNTTSPSFTRIAIQNAAQSGIDGQQVTNFTLANSFIDNVGTSAAGQYVESNIAFNDAGAFNSTAVSGVVSITNSILTNARRHGIDIENGSGTISNLIISNNTLTSSTNSAVSLGTAILVLQQGSVATTAHLTTGTINGNTITNFPSAEGIAILGGSGNASNNTSATLGANGTPINITNNTIAGQVAAAAHMGSNAIRVSMNSQFGVMNFNISCNGNTTTGCTAAGPITNIQGQGISVFAGGTITGSTTINNNVVVANQTLGAGTQGMAVQVDDGPAGLNTSAADYNFIITNNNISAYEGSGIRAIARVSLGKMDVTIQNNLVGTPILANRNGIRVDAGLSAPGNTTICLNISGNSSVGSGINQGIGIRKQGTVATTHDFGIVGLSPSPTTGANAAARINTDNPAGGGVDVLSGDNFTSCNITAMAPTTNQFLAQTQLDPVAPVSAKINPAVQFNAAMTDPATFKQTSYSVVSDTPARTTDQFDRVGLSRFLPPAAPLASGETVTVSLGTLPATKSATIKIQVTVNASFTPGTTRILNQGSVSGSNIATLTTSDPTPDPAPTCAGVGTQTCTPIDRPDTTVVSLTRQSANPNKNPTVTWQIVFADPVAGLTSSNFTLVPGGAVTGASISGVGTAGPTEPDTTWNITANTGTGDGTLGIDLTNDLDLSHDLTNMPFVGQIYTIDKTAPTVTNVTSTSNTSCILNTGVDYCNVADVVSIQLTFSEDVTVNAAGGTPTLTLETGATDREAIYTGASAADTLTFEYTVQAGDTSADLDYLSISALALNGGTIQDIATNSAILTLVAPGAAGSLADNEDIVVDTTAPTVISFVRDTPLGQLTNADTLVFGLHLSERMAGGQVGSIDFRIHDNSPAATTTATVTGIGSGNAQDFTLTVAGGDLANFNGAVGLDFNTPNANPLLGFSMTDRAGNPLANSEPATDEFYTLDNNAPTVTNVTSTAANATYTAGAVIPVTITFSEAVDVTGLPQLTLETGITDAVVDYSGGSGTATLTFNYTVQAGDSSADLEYVGTASLALNGGTIEDAATNNATLPLPTPGAAGSLGFNKAIVIDTAAPTITSFTRETPATSPTNADTLVFRATFSEAVQGVGSADFAVNGTTTATVTNVTPVSASVYDVTVSGGNLASFDGAVGLDFSLAMTIEDAALNPVANTEPTIDQTYTLDNSAPIITFTLTPANPTNQLDYNFAFSANEPIIFTACTLSQAGVGIVFGPSACASPEIGTLIGEGTYTFIVEADDLTGNHSFVSYTWVVDTTEPETTLTNTPTNPTNSVDASFSFTGTDVGGTGVASFECKLDAGAFSACTSPRNYTGLSDGSHTFEVRAVDTLGNTDPSPASYTWLIDSTQPIAPVVTTPANGANTNNPQPPVSGTAEANSTVTVFLDGLSAGTTSADAAGNWTFAAPIPLSDGAHTVRARATDAVGNTSPDSNTNTFTVDTAAPDTIIDTSPTNPTNSTSASFTFHGDDGSGVGGLTFECKLDAASFAACTSPQSYPGPLADGSHTFQVRATDSLGNTDATPASFTWTVDTTAPTGSMTSTATDPTNAASIPVTVQFSEIVSGFVVGDIVATNGSISNFIIVDGDTYTFDLTPSGQGTVSALIDSGSVTDVGNLNFNMVAITFSRVYDSLAPTVTINQAIGQTDPTSNSPVNFTATFNEAVTGFTGTDLNLSSSTTPGTLSAVVSEIAPNNGTTYTIAVSGMAGDGTVVASIDLNKAQDAATNGNTASINIDNSVVYIYTAPPIITEGDSITVTMSENGSPIPFALTLHATDANSDPLTWSILTPATQGTASVAAGPSTSAAVAYTPNTNYNGTDVFVVEVSDGANTDTIIVNVTITATRYVVALPLVVKAGTPDLVISMSVSPNKQSFSAGEPVVTLVTVTNQGSAPSAAFWVDLYINPSSPPTTANQLWNTRCGLSPCFGMAWFVAGGLAPGQSITLSSQSLAAGYSIWPGWFATGTSDLYAYVDSFNPGVAAGAVAESSEANNRAELHGLSVTGINPTFLQPASAAELPPRPASTVR